MKQTLLTVITRVFTRVLTIFLLALIYLSNIIFAASSLDRLNDFGSFVAAGQFAANRQNPYTDESPLIFSVRFSKLNHSGVAPNLNPPISVLIFEQLANIPPIVSANTLRILSAACYVYLFYILVKRRQGSHPDRFWTAVWVFSLAGFWHTLQLGQLYIFLLCLATGATIYSRENKPAIAGFLLGILIAIKPNFIFWAAALGVAGYWSIFLTAGVTSAILSLIPIYFYGITIYKQWFDAIKVFTPDLLIFPGNNSLQGLTARFGSAEVGGAISIFLAIAIIYVIYRKKPGISKINSLAIITSLLTSPIAWTGYTLFLMPELILSEKWNAAEKIAALIFAAPIILILFLFECSFLSFVVLGWFYGWGLLILLARNIRDVSSLR